ncbi:hypothetical protein [Sphingomonas sp. TREG-RG-20F-R18-01]|nr:hypothetical protein [Sphingomonas sp. TREG-RG-20F-R18-01]
MNIVEALAFWSVASVGLGIVIGHGFKVLARQDRTLRHRHRSTERR